MAKKKTEPKQKYAVKAYKPGRELAFLDQPCDRMDEALFIAGGLAEKNPDARITLIKRTQRKVGETWKWTLNKTGRWSEDSSWTRQHADAEETAMFRL